MINNIELPLDIFEKLILIENIDFSLLIKEGLKYGLITSLVVGLFCLSINYALKLFNRV